MTNFETIKIIAMIETNWQVFKDTDAAVDLWSTAFANDPFEIVEAAVIMLIQTDPAEFRPTIAKVRRKMHDIVYGERMTESEAWIAVKDSLHEAQSEPETLAGAKSAWQKLPEDVQKIVTPRQLLEWNWIDSEKLDTVVQSNFLRSYRDITDRRYVKEALPKNWQEKIGTIRNAIGLYKDPEQKPELPQPKRIAYEKPDWMVLRESKGEVFQ